MKCRNLITFLLALCMVLSMTACAVQESAKKQADSLTQAVPPADQNLSLEEPEPEDSIKENNTQGDPESAASETPSPIVQGDRVTTTELGEEYCVLSSEKVGAVLHVPADYADEAVTESAFTLYVPTTDQTIDFESSVYFFFDTSQTAYARDGLVWAITTCSIEDLDIVLTNDSYYSGLCFDVNCHILGVDSDSVYMLANINPARNTVRQFDSDSEESVSSYYAHAEAGMEILEDFVATNQLEVPDGAVDWKAWYSRWVLDSIKQQMQTQ